MATKKTREVWEFGDFQTPNSLARTICQVLNRSGVSPASVLEPTCGVGAFVRAATDTFPTAHVIGADINSAHLSIARDSLAAEIEENRVELRECDFFKTDWATVLNTRPGPWLFLGNPPWVTSAELGMLASANIPAKSNFDGLSGLDAITGKSKFDISEWMVMQYLEWLQDRGGLIAVLIKTAVARKLLTRSWKAQYPIRSAAMYPIDAMRDFGASVDACLFVVHVEPGARITDCDIYESLAANNPSHTFGLHDDVLIAKVDAYAKWQHLSGQDRHYVWRSGIKHDCSRVMELIAVDGHFRNGDGEVVDLEPDFLFPMLKSSDVSKPRGSRDLRMLVTQQKVGDDTSCIQIMAPLTWEYLQKHADILGRRGSSIYRKRSPFSIFGVGDYSFAPWKIVISGFYKSLRFVSVGPVDGKPTVVDDTIYSLPCHTQDEAEFLATLLNSEPAQEFYDSMIFWSDKRPITSELLRRLDLRKLAKELGVENRYEFFIQRSAKSSPATEQLSMFGSEAV